MFKNLEVKKIAIRRQKPVEHAYANDVIARAASAGVDVEHLPAHIAIIMDGNGRWAKSRGLPRLMGHKEGYGALKKTVLAANDLGVKFLTVYAFSAENWRRPKDEISGLMKLIEMAIRAELKEMHEKNARVNVSGRMDEIPKGLRDAIMDSVELTSGNTGITFTLAINYGGRAEIVDAMKKVVSSGVPAEEITEEMVSGLLYNPHHPDPDLMVRTAGEMRWSNFLIWQAAYAELVVTPLSWPEFGPDQLFASIVEYQRRTRKFGAVV